MCFFIVFCGCTRSWNKASSNLWKNNKTHKKETTYFTVKPSSNIDCGFGNSTELKLNELAHLGLTKHGPSQQKHMNINATRQEHRKYSLLQHLYLVVSYIYIPELTEGSLLGETPKNTSFTSINNLQMQQRHAYFLSWAP